MDVLKDFIIQNYGISVLILLSLLVLAVYVGWWLSKFRKDIDNLPCKDHQKLIDNHDRKLSEDASLLHRIEGELSVLKGFGNSIDNMNRTLQMLAAGMASTSSLTQSHSPISLTDKGKKIAEELRLSDIINSNWDKISSIISGEINPYDIQMEFITQLISNYDKYLDSQSMDIIKKDAFMRGIPLIDYLRMIAIMSRDRYFSEHSIDIAEVDKTAH